MILAAVCGNSHLYENYVTDQFTQIIKSFEEIGSKKVTDAGDKGSFGIIVNTNALENIIEQLSDEVYIKSKDRTEDEFNKVFNKH